MATEVVEAQVAPLEERLNEIREQINALCRASARPRVCLDKK